MARPKKPIPGYLLHKASGNARVVLKGTTIYLGVYGTPESEAEYERVIAEWLCNGRQLISPQAVVSVVRLMRAFLQHARSHYPKRGKNTEYYAYRSALRPLFRLYGRFPAEKFGPKELRTVRRQMMQQDWSRKTINRQVGRVIHVFRWGVRYEIIVTPVHHRLETVESLRYGQARETEPVMAVPLEYVNAIKTHVRPPVWLMIQVQLLTGMRPGEVVRMRTRDIADTTRPVWHYDIGLNHKTGHHGIRRAIAIGPRAQQLIRPALKTDLNSYLFESRLGCCYTTDSYRRAIGRACALAGAPHWTPNQLRHTAATLIRRDLDLESAKAALGHRRIETTQIYADLAQEKADEVARMMG